MKALIVSLTAISAVATLGAQESRIVTVNGAQVEVRVPLEAQITKGAPYWAEIVTESTQTLSDGNRITQRMTGRIYRDNEGRTRREEDHPAGPPSVAIVDPVAGASYSLDTERHLAWKTGTPATEELKKKLDALKLEAVKVEEATKSSDVELQRRREDEAKKAEAEAMAAKIAGGRIPRRIREEHVDEALPPQMLEGVSAVGRRSTTTIPAGAIGNDLAITIVSEEWTAPELGVLVMTRRADPRTGESSYRLLNIVRSEPARYLFQVPSDYTVRESGVKKEWQRIQEPR